MSVKNTHCIGMCVFLVFHLFPYFIKVRDSLLENYSSNALEFLFFFTPFLSFSGGIYFVGTRKMNWLLDCRELVYFHLLKLC